MKLLKKRLWVLYAQRDPIFVLQMGRVGSVSVVTAVNQAYNYLSLKVPVYHNHYIANYDLIFERAKKDLHDPSGVKRDIERVDKKNREYLQKYLRESQPIKIISLVRDPVARNASTFFFAFPKFVPDWREKVADKMLTAGEINTIFESKQNYIMTAINWFDEQLNEELGIDVYAVPFDKGKGYSLYDYGMIQLLILRMEDLYRTGEKILRKFLRLPHLQMVKVNTGEKREAYEMYRRFLTYPISMQYLKKTYSSRLAQHFYSKDEIEMFISRWSNPQSA